MFLKQVSWKVDSHSSSANDEIVWNFSMAFLLIHILGPIYKRKLNTSVLFPT